MLSTYVIDWLNRIIVGAITGIGLIVQQGSGVTLTTPALQFWDESGQATLSATLGGDLHASGSLTTRGAVRLHAFASCTALETNSQGALVCGTDDGTSGALATSTGALRTDFDSRYVRRSGGNMTGGLLIKSGNLAATIDAGLLLEVSGTASGRILHAQDQLRSSGSLVIEGSSTFDVNTLFVDAANNRVGILTTSPDAALEVIGTLSGTALNVGAGNSAIRGDLGIGTTAVNLANHRLLTIRSSGTPGILLYDEGGSSDEHYWDIIANNNDFEIQTLNDAINSSSVIMRFNRGTGLAVSSIDFPSAANMGIGTATPETTLEVIGTASGRILSAQDLLRSSGALAIEGGFFQDGLADCDNAGNKPIYNLSTGKWTCGTDADAQNLFETIAVSGQSNVVADAVTDTLTLAAGTNVSITTNASTDTVTINATDTNTTYSPGQGITQNGTVFSLSPSFSGSALEIVGTSSGRVLHAQDQLQSSGSLSVDGNGMFAPNGTVSVTARRETTSEFASFVLNTGGTDQWSFQMRNDGTNDFFLRDNANGRTAMKVIQATNLVNFPTTASGRTLHAQDVLRSSGTLIVEGTAAFQGAVTIVAGNLSDDAILEPDLNADNAPSDGDILTYFYCAISYSRLGRAGFRIGFFLRGGNVPVAWCQW